ncbi:MAG: cysteine methyltransferase [Planctomycetaceae bacterium]|nr:cysteine methyltransferase [Planctomycetaceae bacterium]
MAWKAGQVARLTFGHDSAQEAWRKLDYPELPSSERRQEQRIIKRLQTYAAGNRDDDFQDVTLDVSHMTAFQQAVTECCRRIPIGETRSYGELAEVAGHPGAARAVGRVMATNRFPLIVPCHRVVAAGGAIGGFSAPNGIAMKQRLLRPELTVEV